MAPRGPAARPYRGARGKVVPPPLVEPLVARPELERLLDEALSRRLTTLIADAGFGKSTTLASWSSGAFSTWYTVTEADREIGPLASGLVDAIGLRVPAISAEIGPLLATGRGPDAETDEPVRAGAHAGLVADVLESQLARDLVLVIDDLAEIRPQDPGARFLEAFTHMAPARLHLVMASRAALPFHVDRLRGQGQVLAIEGGTLAFDLGETTTLLEEMLGPGGGALAKPLQQVTDGWPVAVRLAAEALRPVPERERATFMRTLIRPGGTLHAYLTREAIVRSEPHTMELLEAIAPLDRFTVELCELLAVHDAGVIIPQLVTRGLFVRPTGDGGWYELTPLIREFMATRPAPDRRGERTTLAKAATWHGRRGEHLDALRCLVRASQWRRVREVLETSGGALLAAGEISAVLAAIEALPAEQRSASIHELEGEGQHVQGEWDAALRSFTRIAPTTGAVPSRLAWRMGIIRHLRGDLDGAIETYARGGANGDDLASDALLHAWWASALWLRGDVDGCRRLADLALRDANRSQHDQSLAAAHTVLAMLAALDSDRRANDAHYLRALEHARRANDVLQTIRIQVNRGSHFAEEGYYREALGQLGEALRLADLAGFAAWRALALSNRGEVLLRLGRLDEAIAELHAARALYQRLESRFVSYPLGHLGECYLERGDSAVARAHFEEAIRVAETAGDQQGLIPALSGLARILATSEPERAAELAHRAAASEPALSRTVALLAAGSVALARGRREEARATAEAAETLARQRRDRAGLARAIELSVRAAPDAAPERDRLDEALSLWRDIGNPLELARTELTLSELLPPPDAVPLVRRVEGELQQLGARRLAAVAGQMLERLARHAGTRVEIRSLGGFEVLRDRHPVTLAEWRSRKARDVLKLLVAGRGRKVGRDQLLDVFWPEDDPDRSSPRLSVLLSTIRAVLDPDRRQPADRYLATDRSSVWLRLDHLIIDVEEFFAQANRGLRLQAEGSDAARAVLTEAEAAYRGDFLGEDPYEDWAVATREEARGTYQRVAAALARIATAEGQHGVAAGYLWRLLERDPWDEAAHLDLVVVLAAEGRQGEARRAYRRYVARMAELGVEAAAFPGSGASRLHGDG